MRTAIPFDTLLYMEELRDSGMDVKQAEAITKANAKALNEMLELRELATKKDIKEIEVKIREQELKLTKLIQESMWKTIGLIVTFQTLVGSMFFFTQYFN